MHQIIPLVGIFQWPILCCPLCLALFLCISCNLRSQNKNGNEKSAQMRRKHCALSSKARSQKFLSAADPFPGAQDGQNFISWRWSLVTTFIYKPNLMRIDARNLFIFIHQCTVERMQCNTKRCNNLTLKYSATVIVHI